MKTLNLKPFILIFGLTMAFPIYAQTSSSNDKLKKTISKAFQEYKKKENIAIEPNLEKDLQQQYFVGIKDLKPTTFHLSQLAAELKRYYSSIEGIKEILKEWFGNTENEFEERIFGIDESIYVKIYFATKDPAVNPNMVGNSPNKYAILFIQTVPESLITDIYINGKFVQTSNNVKDGIRMRSEKAYKIELKVGQHAYCLEEVLLKNQERRIKKCKIE